YAGAMSSPRSLLILCTLLALPATAFAGMPSYDFTDLAKARIDTISFFLVGYLLIAWGVQWFWNDMRAVFPKLPKLSYRRALMLLTIWALLFVVVLTMISGARELLTPGAWEKTGATYKLAEPISVVSKK
ncbi:MAG TPA: hypothetical protein PLX97_09470, partial [Gemmatales bacterium]|nr:hypothetical protein [Gemmatales bacterium]